MPNLFFRSRLRLEAYWDWLIERLNPNFRAKRKYNAELRFWRLQLDDLCDWYQGSGREWWGLPTPTLPLKIVRGDNLAHSAVMTAHRMRPRYIKNLQLPADFFRDKRVLEVGCGPLVPIMQFEGCARHGLDPLATMYAKSGWPLQDYDCQIVNAAAERMPYRDGAFDAVISVNALDHVDNFVITASEIQRVVKVGGGLYFEVEYHEPTLMEPQLLNDEIVKAAFSSCRLQVVSNQGKRDRFKEIGPIYQLLSNEDRLVLWHGIRLV